MIEFVGLTVIYMLAVITVVFCGLNAVEKLSDALMGRSIADGVKSVAWLSVACLIIFKVVTL